MKKTLLLFVAALCSVGMQAQIRTPQPSPYSELIQVVGLTDVKITYSRPSMRGRTIFGDLVPFDKVWRTGANMNTTVSFSDAVTLGEATLPAGTYALYTRPGNTAWEVYFYTDTNNGGLPAQWDESKIAATVTATPVKGVGPVETFTITVDNLANDGATLGLWWADTYVGVPFGVPSQQQAMASIERVMAGPSANDYFAAASYYHDSGMDLNKAKMWIDKAVEMNADAYWMSRRQSLIYAALGDKKGAIAAAKKSLAVARKAGNADYVKMNEDSLKEWGGM
ncbi:DUF2911 domain-containing protein [Robiginitalea sp. M366]|uniref:DUF2911 domain-containing protein n=1 Tax=Robiginitalea aestuariiviva TaxID=3036903 RepID=UPI00240E3FA0|nr:DUF2911 domain-containing protein [Robiginitalea aestuariiviva]MDG1572786.1 DUF2911 domain-containing protein [Robiginitalea aestuariiviva]